MFKSVQKIFSPPIFTDTLKTQNARFLNVILWVSLFLFILLEIAALFSGDFGKETPFIFFTLLFYWQVYYLIPDIVFYSQF